MDGQDPAGAVVMHRPPGATMTRRSGPNNPTILAGVPRRAPEDNAHQDVVNADAYISHSAPSGGSRSPTVVTSACRHTGHTA